VCSGSGSTVAAVAGVVGIQGSLECVAKIPPPPPAPEEEDGEEFYDAPEFADAPKPASAAPHAAAGVEEEPLGFLDKLDARLTKYVYSFLSPSRREREGETEGGGEEGRGVRSDKHTHTHTQPPSATVALYASAHTQLPSPRKLSSSRTAGPPMLEVRIDSAPARDDVDLALDAHLLPVVISVQYEWVEALFEWAQEVRKKTQKAACAAQTAREQLSQVGRRGLQQGGEFAELAAYANVC
jgi:hypothetical protein